MLKIDMVNRAVPTVAGVGAGCLPLEIRQSVNYNALIHVNVISVTP